MPIFEYQTSDAKVAQQKRWRRWCMWGGGVLLLGLLLLIPTPRSIRKVECRVDPVTGSMQWKTVWLFGIRASTRTDVSPLETRLTASGIAWNPSWGFLHGTGYDVFGRATSYECGLAPPIYTLRPVLKEFAAASTDAELRDFVRVMQFGTDPEQQGAVDVAGEKGLQALSAN